MDQHVPTSTRERRVAPPTTRAELLASLGGGAVGALGLLEGPRGALDPVVLLAWLALAALPAGCVLGTVASSGARRAALRVLAPALWSFELFEAQVLGPASGEPLRGSLGLAAVAGLYFFGIAIGARFSHRRAEASPLLAGITLIALLAAALAPVALGGGFRAAGPARAPASSRVAGLLLDVDPLVVVLECAGVDWTHRQELVYRRAGVEWVERRPWRGVLAPGVLLVVGWTLASVAVRRRRVSGAAGFPENPAIGA